VETYVKDGNSCIGCNCALPDDCSGCNNLKSQVELIKIGSDLEEVLRLSQEYYLNSLEKIKELKAENEKQQEVIYLYALDIQELKAKQKKYSDLLHRILSECGDDLGGRACSLISEALKQDGE